jgi:hypothetical protein
VVNLLRLSDGIWDSFNHQASAFVSPDHLVLPWLTQNNAGILQCAGQHKDGVMQGVSLGGVFGQNNSRVLHPVRQNNSSVLRRVRQNNSVSCCLP